MHFETQRGRVNALNGVDLSLRRGELTGLVGETGSGKSVTARSILRLLEPNASVVGGEVLFEGEDLLLKSERELEAIRGRDICMVFQDARGALNPIFTVGHQIEKVATVHRGLSSGDARAEALRILKRVGISDPEKRAKQYPHQLSGGMCQRVMIAMALTCSPKLIVLDEPTTGLDVTVQADILGLVTDLVADTGASALLITHDLGVVAETCTRMAVMYAGQVVEEGTVEAILSRPLHPYTADLYESRLDVDDEVGDGAIRSIPGQVPDLRSVPHGCAYAPRCSFRAAICDDPPDLREISPGHWARCFFAETLRDSDALKSAR